MSISCIGIWVSGNLHVAYRHCRGSKGCGCCRDKDGVKGREISVGLSGGACQHAHDNELLGGPHPSLARRLSTSADFQGRLTHLAVNRGARQAAAAAAARQAAAAAAARQAASSGVSSSRSKDGLQRADLVFKWQNGVLITTVPPPTQPGSAFDSPRYGLL
jgi:hypothetical protein